MPFEKSRCQTGCFATEGSAKAGEKRREAIPPTARKEVEKCIVGLDDALKLRWIVFVDTDILRCASVWFSDCRSEEDAGDSARMRDLKDLLTYLYVLMVFLETLSSLALFYFEHLTQGRSLKI